MRKKITNCMLILLIALVVLTLSACNLVEDIISTIFPPAPAVTSVEIVHVDGLQEGNNGNYIATIGTKIQLSAKLNDNAPSDMEIKWLMTVDGKTTPIADSLNLEYTFEEFSDKVYEFSVVVNNVASSNKINVVVQYSSKLIDTAISSSTHQIIEGSIQQDVYDISEIVLCAEWNKEAIPEDAVVNIAWTLEGEDTIFGDTEEFAFTAPGEGIFKITLTLTYGDFVVKHTLHVAVMDWFEPVDTIEISLNEGADAFGSGVETQYLQLVNSENRDEITLTATTYPLFETNTSTPVKWVVRDRTGEKVLPQTERNITFVPEYGETIIKAVVDGVESKNMVIFAFTEADKKKYDQYMNAVFVWEDGVENTYITDQTDLNRLVQYAFSTRRTYVSGSGVRENGFPFATASTFDFIADNDDQPLLDTLETVDESGLISINRSWSENEVTGERSDYILYVTDSSRFMAPEANYSPAENVKQEESALVHYTKLDDSKKRTSLPIDDNPIYPEPIKNSQMLYRVLGWGYRPKFDNSLESQKMKGLYEKIRQVALDFMTDEMSDYTKTLIIYEWIAQTVDYDYAIVNAPLEEHESLKYNAFSLEGVFTDADGEGYGQAVCDGRAKAFVALCGVEDIKAIRVTGSSEVNGIKERHAWNKVLIDANGDGVREWYLCDTTWSDRSSANDRTERLNKQYFLVTDAYVAKTHFADPASYNPVCNSVFDYYARTVVENGDADFDLYIDNRNVNGSKELDVAVNYAKDNGVMLEIKVSTSVCNTVNGLRLLIASYTKSTDFDIYTIASATAYNIFIVVFD